VGKQQAPGEALAQHSMYFTVMAMDGNLELVNGRHGEIHQILQISARRASNNTCFIREAEECR